MQKIVRTPTRAEGGITPEEKARLDAHAQMWIGRIMRTDPIERDKIVPAGMRILYAIVKEPTRLYQDAAVPHGEHEAVFTIENMTSNGEPVGSWRMTVDRTDSPQEGAER